MSLKDQVLAAFKKDQANMEFLIESENENQYYKCKVWNDSTEGCLQDFFRLHSRLLHDNFKQIIKFNITHVSFFSQMTHLTLDI